MVCHRLLPHRAACDTSILLILAKVYSHLDTLYLLSKMQIIALKTNLGFPKWTWNDIRYAHPQIDSYIMHGDYFTAI